MSDWAVGDLAVCVVETNWRIVQGFGDDGIGPRPGEVNRVCNIYQNEISTYLALDAYPWPDVFDQSRFRKILPDRHEECEPEFVTLLKRIKRKQPVPASGMPLRENNKDCSRPQAGSPTGVAGDAQGPSA